MSVLWCRGRDAGLLKHFVTECYEVDHHLYVYRRGEGISQSARGARSVNAREREGDT